MKELVRGGKSHPAEEEFETYALGRMEEAQLATFEEHLLTCEECQNRLEETDQFVTAMRDALAHPQVDEGPRRAWWSFSALPKWAWAPGLAAAVLAVVWLTPRTGGPPLEIALAAVRSAPAPASAPAGRRLVLNADVAGLPALPTYSVSVVDTGGSTLFSTTAAPAGSTLRVPIDKRLGQGQYWVRVSSPGGETLREYGLELR